MSLNTFSISLWILPSLLPISDLSETVANALSELTGGLADISQESVSEFQLGPIDDLEISSILDKFNLDFTSFIEEFVQ